MRLQSTGGFWSMVVLWIIVWIFSLYHKDVFPLAFKIFIYFVFALMGWIIYLFYYVQGGNPYG